MIAVSLFQSQGDYLSFIMKKILVHVDFTPASRNASEYAAFLAKSFGGEIQLLHIYKDLIPATVGPEPWSVTVSNTQTKNEALLKKEIDFLTSKYSIEVHGNIRKGLKLNSIKQISREMGADLIVMGKSNKKNKIPDGTILKTIRKSNTPVMIIPEEAVSCQMKNIVLAVDFGHIPDASCFEPLFNIVKTFDASLRVLHVEKKGADINASEMPGKLELGRILGKVSYLYDKIESENVEQGILHFIQNHPTDLLVMVTRQHNILEQLFISEQAQLIIFKIQLPLLVINLNKSGI